MWKSDQDGNLAVGLPAFDLEHRSHKLTFSRSYRNLSPKTRLLIGGGIMAYAAFGLFLSDKAEQTFGMVPTEKDREKLRDAMPKIRTVDKEC